MGSDIHVSNNFLYFANFNPHSRVGSDLIWTFGQSTFPKFQSTLPRGERLTVDAELSATSEFQSTLPRGERHADNLIDLRLEDFNPHSRVGSDLSSQEMLVQHEQFQSTLPRGERRFLSDKGGGDLYISIHTPAWGATTMQRLKERRSSISIHTPAWGATLGCFYVKVVFYISIHTPAWGATGEKGNTHISGSISIHTPAWGATWYPARTRTMNHNFNPHSRVGSDLWMNFQLPVKKDFNPHSRVGSDCKIAQKQF